MPVKELLSSGFAKETPKFVANAVGVSAHSLGTDATGFLLLMVGIVTGLMVFGVVMWVANQN